MIDIESTVFSAVAAVLRKEYDGIFVSGEAVSVPTAFPAVTLVERSNSVHEKMQTADRRENHAVLMYEADIYSNLASGKKQQAKEIAAKIDAVMQNLGFIRTFGQPIDNFADTSIYRYKLRYKGVVGRNYTVYTS